MQAVSTQHIDVLGFSIASEGFFEPLKDVIKQARKAARNRDMVVMVGGRFFIDHPDVVPKMSRTAVIANGVDAVDMAEKLITQAYGSSQIQQPT